MTHGDHVPLRRDGALFAAIPSLVILNRGEAAVRDLTAINASDGADTAHRKSIIQNPLDAATGSNRS